MTRTLARTLMALGLAVSPWVAVAQINNDPPPPLGWSFCIDPDNTQPYSADYGIETRANEFFRCTVGVSGTVTYYGQNSPCYPTAHTYNAAGRIGFGSGPTGSLQSSADDNLMYTYGMPTDPAGTWSYASIITVDPTDQTQTPTVVALDAIDNAFTGASGRYWYVDHSAGNVLATVRGDVVGDGVRINWSLTNLAATPQEIGLWYGADISMLNTNFQAVGYFGRTPVFINVPGQKPMIVETRIKRASDPANFPPYVQFCWGQTTAYGLQVNLGPTYETTDNNGGSSDATLVDELVVSSPGFLRGDPLGGNAITNPPDQVFPDVELGSPAFVEKYYPQSVAANGTRTIISYFRDTWGNTKYTRPSPIPNRPSDQPYTTLIDAPHLLAPDDANTGTNGLANNPFTIYAYVDNIGGYSDVYTATDINDVQLTISLPPGLSLVNGDTATKTLTVVHPGDLDASVSWQVEADGVEVGDLQYTVSITSTPGPPQPIVHTGTIRVAATKQIKLEPAANLISNPWNFTDSSWEAILGLSQPSDFTCYTWDPVQNGYVVSTSASRGRAYWLILNPNTHPNEEVDPYNGAGTPGDELTGFTNIQLKSGWNLIGDPYPYAIPVSQLVGVSAANPAQSYIFKDLVSQSVVSPYLAYWDPSVNNYRYIQGISAMMQPNVGYWIKVLTAQDLTLNYPPVYDVFVPGGRAATSPGWTQSANHWRLNIQGKSTSGQDVENYLGVATGTDAKSLQIPKAPEAPSSSHGPAQDLQVAFDGNIAGLNGLYAQALSNHNGTQAWTMYVQSHSGGYVQLSWPNMSTLPSNLTFKLVNMRTHQSIDMRSRSSVQFMTTANSSTTFQIQSSTNGVILPTIGNVSTSAGRLSTKTPATVTFGLNYDATVSVNVLNSRGQTVAVLRNAQSLKKGTNTAAWNLQDSNGNFVPVGTYQMEISATVDGNTARKVASVNVLR